MDLRTGVPRSGLERLGGVVMVARTLDKCRAHLAGTLGEYVYDCPLDKQLFEFLGTDAEEFASVVSTARSDEEVAAFIGAKLAGRAEEEVLAWNQDFLRYEPDLSRERYAAARRAIEERAPGRDDITLWVDVVDVEEGRPVPTAEEVRERKALLGLAE
jgi:hypothetical protein